MVPEAEARRVKLAGIDTLRFFAAMWVAFSHGALFPLAQFLPATRAGHVITSLYDCTFNGTAAVVLFFLISGFCIHYPNVGRGGIDWRTFLARRMVRIGVPLGGAAAIAFVAGPATIDDLGGVLWSIYCEIVYYLLYPLLFLAMGPWGTRRLLGASAIVAAVLLLTNPTAEFVHGFGPITWLFCLPMWLAGVVLAERYSQQRALSVHLPIWLWRAGAIGAGLAANLALYHVSVVVGYGWAMLFVAGYAFFWLHEEFVRGRERGAVPLWEAMGAFSYSIYLMHELVLHQFDHLPVNLPLVWALQLFCILAGSYLFYLLVERPGHGGARKIRLTSAARAVETSPPLHDGQPRSG